MHPSRGDSRRTSLATLHKATESKGDTIGHPVVRAFTSFPLPPAGIATLRFHALFHSVCSIYYAIQSPCAVCVTHAFASCYVYRSLVYASLLPFPPPSTQSLTIHAVLPTPVSMYSLNHCDKALQNLHLAACPCCQVRQAENQAARQNDVIIHFIIDALISSGRA